MIPLEIGPLAPSRKLLKKGIEFNLMTVGESGLGKSTLINAMFNNNSIVDRQQEIPKTIEINRITVEIEEPGTRIRLTVIDTPGFGDNIDNENICEPILNYVESQLMNYYKDETGINRQSIVDGRVHCCLYFIAPSHRGLAALDIKFMLMLHKRVNIFPIIAKADGYTNKELSEMKQIVLEDIKKNDIQIYQFPVCDSDDDPDFVRINEEFKKLIPFSVVSSSYTKKQQNNITRVREYPWGVIDIDDPSTSDFTYLRTMLLKTHINDLREHTADIHYENFRSLLISGAVEALEIPQSPISRNKLVQLNKESHEALDSAV